MNCLLSTAFQGTILQLFTWYQGRMVPSYKLFNAFVEVITVSFKYEHTRAHIGYNAYNFAWLNAGYINMHLCSASVNHHFGLDLCFMDHPCLVIILHRLVNDNGQKDLGFIVVSYQPPVNDSKE